MNSADHQIHPRPILQHVTDCVIICDLDGKLQYANNALFRALGYDAKDVSSADELLTEAGRTELQAAVRLISVDAEPAEPFSVVFKGRPYRHVVFKFRLAERTGDEVIYIAEGSAIPKQQHRYLEAILEAIPDVVMVFDRNLLYRHVFTNNSELLVDAPSAMIGRSIRELVEAEEAKIGETLIPKVIETGQQEFAIHRLTVASKPKWFSVWVIPVDDNGETCALWVSRDVTEGVQGKLSRIASLNLLQELLNIQERERQLLAGELHDGLAQDVVGARMWLESISADWSGMPEQAGTALKTVREAMDRAVTQCRHLINGLRPILSDYSGIEAGLKALVQQFSNQSNVNILFTCEDNIGPLFPLLASSILRICQEALSNVVQHSKARTAVVSLSSEGKNIHLVVEDDGVGFDPDGVESDLFGVESIRQRARVFGGNSRYEAPAKGGTRLVVEMPALAMGHDRRVVTEALSEMMLEHAESYTIVSGKNHDAS